MQEIVPVLLSNETALISQYRYTIEDDHIRCCYVPDRSIHSFNRRLYLHRRRIEALAGVETKPKDGCENHSAAVAARFVHDRAEIGNCGLYDALFCVPKPSQRCSIIAPTWTITSLDLSGLTSNR